MNRLKTQPNFVDSDTAFRRIVEAHRGVSPDASAALNARLVLILANHIGDLDVLEAAVVLARLPLDQPGLHRAPPN